MPNITSPLPLYKCLSDETRLRCLLLIEREQELCVCELVAALDEIQPKISRHLAQLRKYELLVDRRQGQWVFYQLNPALPKWTRVILATTLQANPEFIEANIQRLEAMGSRPTRAQVCCKEDG